jgi:hypothetical protein
MTRVKMVLSWCIPMVLIIVVLMGPVVAHAGSVKIWPDQTKPVFPNGPYQQTVFLACSGLFYAPLTLPAGAIITNITYYHHGEAAPSGTSLGLYRLKMGKVREQLAGGSSTDSTGTIISVNVPITGEPSIKAGYRYYIGVTSDNENSNFLGVKITYQQ